jgi:hypothetical protein
LACLQDPKTGKTNRGLSGHEFTEAMVKVFLPWMEQVIAENPGVFPNGKRSVLLMLDRAPWHTSAMGPTHDVLTKLGLKKSQVLPHPPDSPDFQGPIEWSHSILLRAVKQRLAKDAGIRQPSQIKRLIKQTWEGSKFKAQKRKADAMPPLLSPEQVTAMFKKLRHTYEEVVRNGGRWGRKGC